jgi:hypothetical protein
MANPRCHSCPLYPRKQTLQSVTGMSALCQSLQSGVCKRSVYRLIIDVECTAQNDPADFDFATPSDTASGMCARG